LSVDLENMALENSRVEVIDFLHRKVESYKEYHNHKENMVNAGFVVQLTLFSTIILENVWPPQWISGVPTVSGLSTLMVYLMFWGLIQYFIYWQIQNKIIASLLVNGFENSLRKVLFCNSELDFNVNAISKPTEVKWFWQILGMLLLRSGIMIKYDASPTGIPKFISDDIHDSFVKGSAAKVHEKLMLFAGVFMLILASLRIVSMILNN
jgi:hypothetical protein